jgi:hypothetical protein
MRQRYLLVTLFLLLAGANVASSQRRGKITAVGSRLVAESSFSDTSHNNSRKYGISDSLHYTYPSDSTNKWNQVRFSHFVSGKGYKGIDHYSFAPDGSMADHIRLTWNEQTSAYDSLLRYINTTSGPSTTRIFQYYEPSIPGWRNSTRITLTRDAANNVIDSTAQRWAGDSIKWSTEEMHQCAYIRNGQGKVMCQVTRVGYGGQWYGQDSFINTYDDTSGHLVEQIKYICCYGAWGLSERTTWAWDSVDRLREQINYYWIGYDGWAIGRRTSYSYDTAGNNILRYYEGWTQYPGGGRAGYYYPANKDTIVYNSFNQPTMELRFLAAGNGHWAPMSRDYAHYYYYEPYTYTYIPTPTAVQGAAADQASMSLSPNPAQQVISIILKWKEPQAIQGAISDISGRVYTTFTAPAVQAWNTTLWVSGLPPGNYLLSVKGSKGAHASQMISIVR